MSVSVIIPSLLSGPHVREPIESVVRAAAAIDHAEVLIIANGPQPYWDGPVLHEPHVQLLYCQAVGPAAARNFGLDRARHRLVLFTDDDCVVPRDWCSSLAWGLTAASTAAVAAPVGVRPTGPITAFLNYQRIFDAPPLTSSTVRYLITANCGIDRSRTTASFNADLFKFVGAEDAEFGYQIRDAGGTITWLGDTAPVIQDLAEDIAQITDRFHRYGQGSARLYQACQRSGESVPGAMDWFADLAAGQAADRRRFREFADPKVRATLASIDLIATSSWLVGYLLDMSSLIGYPFIRVDRAALTAAWAGLGRRLSAISGSADWAALAAKARLMWTGKPDADDLSKAIGEILTEHVTTDARLPSQVTTMLDCHARTFHAELSANSVKATQLADMTFGHGCSIDALSRELRRAGLSFRDGMHDLEQAVARRLGPEPGSLLLGMKWL